jgi:DNA-directed RNA polymerase specialized sigma24 family protein/CheY-like chemotaxis protein
MTLAEAIAPHLLYLRRYARALLGNQHDGDAYVRSALEAVIEAPGEFPQDVDARLGIYRTFHAIWSSTLVEVAATDGTGAVAVADRRLAAIVPRARQALLLTAMEGFSATEAAFVMASTEDDIRQLVDKAIDEIQQQTATHVLIIEDEPIIAMDIEGIVRDLGHDVLGVAMTRDEAVALALDARPGLVLADIQLADDSSGIEAVSEILRNFAVPVIFITAFPERLLTGERPEPTFLITKPFERATVNAAIAQALFFTTSHRTAEGA